MKKSILYSYTIPYDDGAAPNPFWGKLTLAICKPVIRRTADIDDWVVATGSKNAEMGDLQFKIVYVMKVTNKMSLQEYDDYCKKNLPNKIPDTQNNDTRLHIGDCIYDFTSEPNGKLRPSVHGFGNRETDLGGENVLLSSHFYYFGNKPIDLPKEFHRIIKSNQGHKSKSNDAIADSFVSWIEGKGLTINKLYGEPQIHIDLRKDNKKVVKVAKENCRIDTEDEKEFKEGIC